MYHQEPLYQAPLYLPHYLIIAGGHGPTPKHSGGLESESGDSEHTNEDGVVVDGGNDDEEADADVDDPDQGDISGKHACAASNLKYEADLDLTLGLGPVLLSQDTKFRPLTKQHASLVRLSTVSTLSRITISLNHARRSSIAAMGVLGFDKFHTLHPQLYNT
ncbi:hypothetical protein EV360DRAFT_88817 [Lentinula raphanica]|nr:hypothetical protein EV360DRAFT_88817 [Lentinula raphanica]